MCVRMKFACRIDGAQIYWLTMEFGVVATPRLLLSQIAQIHACGVYPRRIFCNTKGQCVCNAHTIVSFSFRNVASDDCFLATVIAAGTEFQHTYPRSFLFTERATFRVFHDRQFYARFGYYFIFAAHPHSHSFCSERFQFDMWRRRLRNADTRAARTHRTTNRTKWWWTKNIGNYFSIIHITKQRRPKIFASGGRFFVLRRRKCNLCISTCNVHAQIYIEYVARVNINELLCIYYYPDSYVNMWYE